MSGFLSLIETEMIETPPTHTHTTLNLNKATVLLLLCGKVDML